MYGPNLIDVPVKSYIKLLFEEVSILFCSDSSEHACSIYAESSLMSFLLLTLTLSAFLGPQPILCVPSVQHYALDG